MADQNFRVKRGLEVGIGGTVITATASGSVGIGTTNPTSKLTVFGDTNINNIQPTTVSYASSFSVAGQETAPQEISFSNDGKTMYVLGSNGDDITWYTLSTPWDITTATHVSQFSVAGQLTSPTGLYFKLDGTKFYVVGSAGVGAAATSVNQYSCRTPWDLTTASYDSVAYSVIAQDTVPQGVEFKPDGTRMYVVGSTNDSVYQYSLSTPWDVSTVSYGSSFSVAGQEAGPTAIRFSLDGTKLLLTGSTGDDINYYNLSTPWDITTTSFVGIITSVGAAPFNETSPAGLYWKPDGTRLYLTGTAADTIYQFNMTSDADLEVTGKASVYGQLHIYESTTLYSDLNVNNIVGVGTTTTALKLKIQGDTNLTGGFNATGAVGIGITNPQQKLDVRNGTILVVNPDASGLRVLSGAATSYASITIGRTVGDASISVAGGAGQWANNSSSGDLVIRTETTSTKLLFTNGSNNATLAIANNNVGIGTTNPTAALTIGTAGITTFGQSQIYLNGATSNRIDFNTNGQGAPTFTGTGGTTRSAGTKIILYPQTSGISVDYAFGIESGHIWQSVNGADSTYGFKWYGGTTQLAILRGDGRLGIGTTNPTVALQLSPTASISNVGTGITLPGTVGAALTVAQFLYNNVNASYLRIKATRNTTGSDWFSASTKLVQVTDVTEQGYIEFNPNGATYGMAFGGNNGSGTNVEWARFLPSGNLGIGTTNPGALLDVFGTAISFGDNTTSAAQITRKNTNAGLVLSGNGANIELYGSTHATLADRAYYDALNHNFRNVTATTTYVSISTSTSQFNNVVQIGSATSTGTVSQTLQVTGGAYVSGSVGIGTTNPTAKLEPVDTAANPSVAPVVFIQRPNNVAPASIAPTNADLRIKSHSSNFKIYAEDHSANPLMILTGSGNLGIGTTNPNDLLHLSTSENAYIRAQRTASGSEGAVIIGASSLGNELYSRSTGNTAKDFRFVIGTAEALRINTSGFVGIGITNPGNNLQVAGSAAGIRLTDNTAAVGNLSSTGWLLYQRASNAPISQSGFSILKDSGADALTINSSGDIGIGTDNPQYKLQVQGSSAALDTRLHSVAEKTRRINGNTASLVYSTGSGNIAICTNPTGSITLNVTNIPTDTTFDNSVLTFSVIISQTGTARSCTAVNLNGYPATIRWFGGSIDSALVGVTTTIGYDIYSFTGINTVGSASTTANYAVLGTVVGGYR